MESLKHLNTFTLVQIVADLTKEMRNYVVTSDIVEMHKAATDIGQERVGKETFNKMVQIAVFGKVYTE